MTLRIGSRTFICFYGKHMFFRILGRGLSIGIDRPKLFSERYGYKKVLRLRRLSIEVLR